MRFAGFFLLIALLSGTARAQGGEYVPSIVITPTKTAHDVDEIPFAATLVDSETARETQAQSVDDVLKNIPNVYAAGGPRTSSEEPSLRGLSDRRIVIKVDGMRRNFRAQYSGRYFLDPWMIDKVEVVRGANSTIDGSGAIGGVIELSTPEAQKSLRGSEANWGAQLRGGYQSANDEFAFMKSAYGAYEGADAFVAYARRDSGDLRTGSGETLTPSGAMPVNWIAKAGYAFNAGSRSDIRVSDYKEKAEMPVNPFQPLSASNGAATRKSRVRDISFRQSLRPDSNARDWVDLGAIVYRSEYDIDTRRRSDGRYDETDFLTNGFDVHNTSRADFGAVRNALTLGVEYFEDEQKGKRNGATRALLGNGKDNVLGVYAQDEIGLLDGRLMLLPGVRFDVYEVTPGDAALASNRETEFSPKLGVNYKVDEVWSAYASLSEAFRAPTLTELYAFGVMYPGNTLISNPNLRPETAFEKEIGLRFKKTNAFVDGDRVRAVGAVFHNRVSDYIEQISGATTTQFRNDSKATLVGAEFEGQYALAGVTASLSAGYTYGQNDTADQPLSDVPSARVGLGVETFLSATGVTLGARSTYYAAQSRIPPDQLSTLSSKEAVLFDVYGAWTPFDGALKGLEVRFGIDNVFDTTYRRYLSFQNEAGRNFKVDLAWRF